MLLFKRRTGKKSDASSNDLPSRRLVLQELRVTWAHQIETSDALDSKIVNLLGSASLIISLMVTLQTAIDIRHGVPYWVGFFTVLTMYGGLLFVTLKALRPTNFYTPIPSTWEEVHERYFGLNESDATDLLISTHLEMIARNVHPLRLKSRHVKIAAALLAVIVLSLLCMTAFEFMFNPTSPLVSPLAP